MARPRSSRTTSTLISVSLTDWCDLKGIHSNFGVVHFEFTVPTVDNIHNSINLNQKYSVQLKKSLRYS